MSRRDTRYYDDDFDITRRRRPRSPEPRPGSAGWGVTSFVMAMLNGLFLFGVFFVAVLMNINQNAPIPDNDPRMVVLGFSFLGGMALAVVGLILGFVGVGQANGTIFAILGIVFNGLILLSVLGVIVVGLAFGG